MTSTMRCIAATALALAVWPVAASSTMCMFHAPDGAPVPDLEFLGYGELGGILIAGEDGPRSLASGTYALLALDPQARRIRLVYTNPGDPTLPPSFRLEGEGPRAQLVVAGDTYEGEFACGQW
ncbi:hypothetical protein ACF3M1_14995 [Luteimonas sp. WGS1318]|uniref:hypothetical protein n=1 Tax=Luteimonas sp. WGS1318 TaxID=3366815 RepID=UPI00372D2F48